MALPHTVTVSADVMVREVGDELVMLDLASGTYFGLDPVGARMWQLIAGGHSPEAACTVLLDEYDVERSQLEKDMGRLLNDLQAKGLVTSR